MERRHHRATFQRLLSTGAVAATLGLAFLLLLAPGATAAPACTGFQVKQGKTPTKTAPGRRLRLSYSVRSVDATARDVALGLIVPPSAIVQKSGSTTHQSKRVTPTNATLIDAQLQPAFGVYFPTSTLLGKKSRKFSATFTVAKCATMPASLLFQARLIDVKNNTIVCTQDFAQQKVRTYVGGWVHADGCMWVVACGWMGHCRGCSDRSMFHIVHAYTHPMHINRYCRWRWRCRGAISLRPTQPRRARCARCRSS